MYKVLIADDETIIRWGIRSFVEQNGNFQVVAMAEDGEMALEKARETQPDAMFVDINMPFLNGLDFIAKIRQEQPKALIVIVTGYDEFDFARKAINLGVFDYVLKPIMEDTFFDLLRRMQEELDRQRLQNKYLRWARERLEQNYDYLMERFLNEWLGGHLDESEVREQVEYLHLTLPETHTVFLVALIEDDGKSEWQDENLLYFACRNIIDELGEEYGGDLSFRLKNGHIGVLMQQLDPTQAQQLQGRITDSIRNYLKVGTWCSIANGQHREEIPQTVDQAERRLDEQNSYSPLILDAVRFQNEHYDDPDLSLELVARKLFVTPQYLSRLFRQETGQTFVGRLSGIRMKKAMELLADPRLKLYEIAKRTGFSTQHYFSNAFKKAIGMAPVDYRKKILHEDSGDET